MSDTRTFVLRDKQIVMHCVAFISSLSLIGQRWQVCIKPYVRNRTRSQEKLWHAWVGIIAKEKGYTAKQMKIVLKDYFDLYEYVTIAKTGKVIPSLRSTADLTVTEYMDLITQTEVLASREGILLPRDHDYYVSMGIDKDEPPTHGAVRRTGSVHQGLGGTV